MIDEEGRAIDYESVKIDSNVQFSAAMPMIRVLEVTGNDRDAGALKAAAKDFLHRHLLITPLWRPPYAAIIARTHLWESDMDKALAELEILPGAYMRDWWYLRRRPEFQVLQGHPRFEAVMERLQSQADADRARLETLGDNLPACVANMRTIIK